MPQERKSRFCCSAAVVLCVLLSLGLGGCAGMAGYSEGSLFPEDVSCVYVEMFENRTFWRGVEYELSGALAKHIEAETPYKIVTSRDRADSVISGQILSIHQSVLSIDRQIGKALEKEVELYALINWKNLKTGDLLVDGRKVSAAVSYSEQQEQSFNYASRLAANNLARRIVELMENQW